MLYDPDEWDTAGNNKTIGVAVVTSDCRFAISKELHLTDNIAWSAWLAGDIDGVSNSTPDYEGQSNTNIIRAKSITQESSPGSYNASYYADSLTLTGKNGYLPAASELCVLWSNRDKINDVLTVIGSTTIDEKMKEFGKNDSYWNSYTVWTSTNGLIVSNTATVFLYGEEGSSCSYGGLRKSTSGNSLFAFPFFPITETVHVTIHINTYQITLQFRKGDFVNLSYFATSIYTTWYETEDFSGEALTQIDSIQSDMTLYAKLDTSPDNP